MSCLPSYNKHISSACCIKPSMARELPPREPLRGRPRQVLGQQQQGTKERSPQATRPMQRGPLTLARQRCHPPHLQLPPHLASRLMALSPLPPVFLLASVPTASVLQQDLLPVRPTPQLCYLVTLCKMLVPICQILSPHKAHHQLFQNVPSRGSPLDFTFGGTLWRD